MVKADPITIALLGFGTVGQGVYDILSRHAKDGFNGRLSRRIDVKKILINNPQKQRELQGAHALFTTDIQEILTDKSIHIVVEVIGGPSIVEEWLGQALRAGKHVVTANKALLALYGESMLAAARDGNANLLFEAAVAGGIPLIRTIREGLSANQIQRFYGIVNGTCNYILSEMETKGSDFAAALKQAQDLGYAEADPSFDIDGKDAAHKLVILARLCFALNVHIEDLHIEGIRHIDALDSQFARQFGYAIRLLAIAKRGSDGTLEVRVEPVLIPHASILAKVDGPYNAAYIEGDAVGDVMLYGAGAGRYPTASAVVSDIIDIAERIAQGTAQYRPPYGIPDAAMTSSANKIHPFAKRTAAYYLRLAVRDEPHVLETVTKELAEQRISIASLYQPPSNAHQTATIAILTHETTEQALQTALKKIDSCGFLVQKSKRVPIEPLKFN